MTIKILFHPVIALILFMAGMILASETNILFGLCTIFGGLLLGFSPLRDDVRIMTGQRKFLLYGAFIFLMLIMSTAFLTVIKVLF